MARWLVLVFGVLGLACQVSCNYSDGEVNKYDNFTLIRILPKDDAQLEAIHGFKDPEDHVEILKMSRGFNDSLDVLVPPDRMDFIKLFAKDMLFEEKTQHYGRTLLPVDRTPRRRVLRNNLFEYLSFADITNVMRVIAASHPHLVTLQQLGESYEGRPMILAKVSANPRDNNPIIFVDGGIHAREWVAPSMAMYILHRLTQGGSAQRELEGVDWYILPVVNPDGYEFSRSSPDNRMWRKTRSKSPTGTCYGVDGNRNYGFKWAVSGVSSNPCDKETYAGPKAFSEPETRIVRKIMMDNRDRIKLYVSLHSYGQFLVYPWGYTGDFMPKEWKKLDRMARMVSSAVERAGGQPFKVLSAGRWYPAAGGSDDYAFGAAGVPYSYTMELTDGYEFSYPQNLLRVVLPQFYEGFKVFAQQIRREFKPV